MTHYWVWGTFFLKNVSFIEDHENMGTILFQKQLLKVIYKNRCSSKQLFYKLLSRICVQNLEIHPWRSLIWLKPTTCNFTKTEMLPGYFSIILSVDVEQLFFRKAPNGCLKITNLVVSKTQWSKITEKGGREHLV